jgi:ABC-type sulfate/molybdate transport systems ATPase subunit
MGSRQLTRITGTSDSRTCLGTVVVTHQVAEVWDFADRVVALVAGNWALEEGQGAPLDDFMRRYREVVPA